MNNLFLHTRPTGNQREFDTFWMTGMNAKGRVRTTIPLNEDGAIAAELAAAQYLLEERHACGHNKAGAGLCLYVTFGAIRKLLNAESGKGHLAPYAIFLRTRFLGAEISVANRKVKWIDEQCEERVESLIVSEPKGTLIEVGGFGQVELTAHAVEQYVTRFGRKPEKAWRTLQEIAKAASPVTQAKRSAFHDIKHRRQGTFALNQEQDLLMVITPPEKVGGLPKLVTIYRPSDKSLGETRQVP
ncbi:MAG: hypothetical protein IT541_10085 [Hyphomicrobiales bacterium]|nr:hypothetical protein [Hyphomicrobiales bacterium]